MPVSCIATGCKESVPLELEPERVCVLHFVASVEQTCADMRRETALGKASRERCDEIERYISERGEKLVRVATSGHRLSGQLKNRVLSLFLILMNLRENLDRGGKPGRKPF